MKKFMALTLAVMTVLSTVSFAAPQMADTVIGATEIYDDVTEVLPAEDNAEVQDEATLAADTNDYGTLIARVDFDDVDAGTSVTTSNIKAGAANWIEKNLPEGFPDLYLNMTGSSASKITVVADDDGNGNHAEWENSASGWPKVGFYADSFMPEGKYTLKFDVKYESYQVTEGTETTSYPNISAVFTPNNPDGTHTNGERNVAGAISGSNTGTLKTIAQTRGFISGKKLKEQNAGDNLYEFVGLGKVAFYLDKDTNYNYVKVYLDNIELYYEAPSTKVVIEDGKGNTLDTIKLFDGKTTNDTCFIQSSYATIDLTQYKSSVDNTDTSKIFSGWKNKTTGAAVSTNYTATADSVVTLVPAYSTISKNYGFNANDLDSIEDLKATVSTDYQNLEKQTVLDSVDIVTIEDGTKVLRYVMSTPTTYEDSKLGTQPSRNDLNLYFNKQINSTKLLNTQHIKGISYTFRLLTPDGVEDSTYFTGVKNGISTGAYFMTNWWEDEEETPCYTGEKDAGWHWGECVHAQSGTLVAKGADYNGEWLTAYIDLEGFNYTGGTHKGKNWSNAYKCQNIRFRIVHDLYTSGVGFTVDVKSIDFVLADDYKEPEFKSCDFYDLRKGYIDVTLSEKIDVSDVQLLTNVVTGAAIAHVDETSNANGTYTYRFYSKYDLNGKTVGFKEYDTGSEVINLPSALLAKTHTYTADEVVNAADGENLVPNGDFSNPYYIPLATDSTKANNFSNGGAFDAEMTDDGLAITLTNTTEWCTTAYSNVKFKPNTNYYFALEAAFTGDSKDSDGNAHHATGNTTEQVTLYVPVLDGRFDINISTNNKYNNGMKVLDYIPSTKENFKINLNSSTFGKDKTQSFAKVLSIYDTDYYTSDSCTLGTYEDKTALANDLFNNPRLSLQLCTTNGKNAGFYTKEANGVMTNAAGLQYTIKNFVIKEMFPVTLKYGETTIDTLYAAKDIEIKLPEPDASKIGGAFFEGWSDGTKTYKAGDTYTLTKAEGVTLTAQVSFAPETQNEISVRTDTYTGIRFKAAVKQAIKDNEATTEIGYYVTRKVLLDAANIESKDFVPSTGFSVNYVTGKAYVKADNINKVFASDDTLKLDYFTAVVYNIPSNQYDDVLVARPYVTVGGTTYLGDVMEMSLRQAATAVKSAEGYVITDSVIESIVGSSN